MNLLADNPFLFITATGFTVALLHAAIPTHWLPFVMVGRARGWSTRQILMAVTLAGGGHILTTTLLGTGLAWFGFELSEHFDHAFHLGVGAVLVVLGAWLAFRKPHGTDCSHCQGGRRLIPESTDRAALWGLFVTLTLSPCELFLPVYLTAVPYGPGGVAWLSLVLALATLGSMVGLTWLTLRGTQRFGWLARPNPRAIGVLLLGLGLATALGGH